MKFLALFLIGALTENVAAQSFEWVREGSGLGQDAGQRIAVDAEGNVYTTGYFSGKAFFGGTLYEGEGIFDIYLAKYSPWGDLMWLKSAGGVQSDVGYGIGIDSKGFIYVTGYFTTIAAFGESPGLVRLTSSGSTDIFIAKYDKDGNFIWAKKAGGEGEDQAFSLEIDRFDNVFVTGYFSKRCYFENKTAISQGSNDAFIAKYDTDGNCAWINTLGGASIDKSFSVAVDSAGYSYITGFYYYAAVFSNSSDTLHADGGSSDIFICKYNPSGEIVHAERAGGYYNDAAYGIAVDKDKAVLITGYFLEEINFGDCYLRNHRYNDVFVAKYDSNFKCEWALREGGKKLDMGLDIGVDIYGNVYVTGIYDSIADFSGRTVHSVDYYDIFICKYSGKGALLWLQTPGGYGGDFSKAICVRDDGAIYITGYYMVSCSFGGIETPLSEVADIFLAKMNQPVGILNVAEDISFRMYPNPNAGSFFIEVGDFKPEPLVITVFDISGKIVHAETLAAHGSRLPFRIDPAPGIYLVRVETATKVMTGRVVVFDN